MYIQEYFEMLQYLLATNYVDFIAGDFNYDFVKSIKR